jgi:hypothetical protein
MNNFIKYVVGILITLVSVPVFATTEIWTFNLPSTSLASQTPPYPTVATLSLTQVGSNVQFTLDPNESSPGVADPLKTFVDKIDYVYMGRALTGSDFVWNSGAPVSQFTYETNQNNMDSGYKTQNQHILVDFVQRHGTSAFSFNKTSAWTINGVTLGDFTNTFATSGPKPTPTYGVISVSPYTLTNQHPTPSNWVTGASVAPVPEPATYAMLLTGFGLIGFMAWRRRKNQNSPMNFA